MRDWFGFSRQTHRYAGGRASTTSSACGAIAWSRSRRSAGPRRRTIAAATRRKATRRRRKSPSSRRGGPACSSLQDSDERSRPQLLERQAAHLNGFVLADRTAAERAQEVVQQSLARRRIVEHVADERRLRRLL